MKKIYSVILISFFLFPVFAIANTVSSLEDVLKEIILTQNVNTKSEIDCQKISDEQFARLGDAVMSVMHPDEQQHDLMDQIMGGKESQSLKIMHIMMGKRYLGCLDTAPESMMGVMPMMGMMTGNRGMGNMMDGNFGWRNIWAWWSWIPMILSWILMILGIIVLTYWLINQTVGRKKEKSALDILKERYAKGEISEEDFEEKKKDLR